MEKAITFESWGRTRNGLITVDTERKRIQLLADDEDLPGVMLPYATCTAALDGLAPDEWAVKDWSENEGILDLLVAAGIVKEPHRFVPSGWVMVPVCRLKEG